jgi:hypothetical protein
MDRKKEPYEPPMQWYEEFSATDAAIKALFNAKTYEAFKNLEKRVDPQLGTDFSNPIHKRQRIRQS